MSQSTDLATFDPSVVEQSADPGTFVVLACERAKDWLEQAVEHGDMDHIVEIKSQAEAIRIYSTQKQLGKDAELAAAEIVRRAERGLGVTIRRGQEEGSIGGKGQPSGKTRRSPREFGTDGDLYGHGHQAPGIFRLADDVEDDEFEEAVTEAKDEGNLSRTNVARKIARKKIVNAPDTGRLDRSREGTALRVARVRDLAQAGHTSDQIADLVGMSTAGLRQLCRDREIELVDKVVGKRQSIDPNRIVSETVASLEGLAMGLDLLEGTETLDRTQVEWWSTSLNHSLRSLNRLAKQLKGMAQ